MITKDDLYFCYSLKMSNYLKEKKIKFLFIAFDKKGNPFSIYARSETLSKALKEYKLTT